MKIKHFLLLCVFRISSVHAAVQTKAISYQLDGVKFSGYLAGV